MRFPVVVTVVGLLFLGSTSPVWAWGPAGHKLVASVAFRQLTDTEQKKVIELLKSHPRFDADFTDKMPDEVSAGDEATAREWFFQQAAVWPDLAKGIHGPDKAKFNRPVWHYINQPIFLTNADKVALDGHLTVNTKLDPPATAESSMNVIQSIRFARSELTGSHASAEEKALMLTWLFHLTGDLHQPLHSSALFSQKLFPHGDRGGNAIKTKQRGNLHSVWDGFPGGNVKFTTLRNRAITFVNDPGFAAIRTTALGSLDEKTWFDESVDLAKTVAYGTEVMNTLRDLENMDDDIDGNPLDLSETYLKEGSAVADRRLQEAGIRLGKILKEVVSH